jgi:hypothetical protein
VVFYGIHEHQIEMPIRWKVDGQLYASGDVAWSQGGMVVFPQCESWVGVKGKFSISL